MTADEFDTIKQVFAEAIRRCPGKMLTCCQIDQRTAPQRPRYVKLSVAEMYRELYTETDTGRRLAQALVNTACQRGDTDVRNTARWFAMGPPS